MGRDYISNVSHFVVSVKCFLNISKFFSTARGRYFFCHYNGDYIPIYIFFDLYIFFVPPVLHFALKNQKIFLHSCHCLSSLLLTSGITYNTIGIFWSRAEFPPQREREKLIYHSVSLSLRFSKRLVSSISALS